MNILKVLIADNFLIVSKPEWRKLPFTETSIELPVENNQCKPPKHVGGGGVWCPPVFFVLALSFLTVSPWNVVTFDE